MYKLTLEGMKAGAFGFTTSRTNSHKTPMGGMVPSRFSEVEELMGIGRALGKVGYGAFGMNSDFDIEESELEWMTKLGKETGRPVWFLLTDRPTDDQRWRRLMDGVRNARKQGAYVTAQVPGRPVGVLLGADTALNPFTIRPSYQKLLALPIAERMARLRDPAVRREILADSPSEELLGRLSQFRQHIVRRWHRMFKLGNPPNYEPPASESIAAIAEREGRTPDEVAYDYITSDPANLIFFPVTGYNVDNLDVVHSMLTDDATVLGLSDGGAHCSSILDAGMPTWMLTHWVRDRTRGPKLPLEFVVKRQTSEPASFFGLNDRGVLAVGKKADVNVLDLAGLQVQKPEVVYDLPAGGRRLVQQVDGYKTTLVSGVPLFENGQHTGALPGKLVRAGR
jgi:N-acyl-D-aspartate/D-glutamate deacylase